MFDPIEVVFISRVLAGVQGSGVAARLIASIDAKCRERLGLLPAEDLKALKVEVDAPLPDALDAALEAAKQAKPKRPEPKVEAVLAQE